VDHAEGERLIVHAAKDENGKGVAAGEKPLEGLESLAIREAEIEEDEIDAVVFHSVLGIDEAVDLALQLELVRVRGEELGDEARIAGIILDEENFDRLRS